MSGFEFREHFRFALGVKIMNPTVPLPKTTQAVLVSDTRVQEQPAALGSCFGSNQVDAKGIHLISLSIYGRARITQTLDRVG